MEIKTILPKDLKGKVLVFSGQYGSGKSLATLFDPHKTVFIDADRRKAEIYAMKYSKMQYFSVNSDDSSSLVKTGELFIDAIANIDYSRTAIVVIDNLYEVEQGISAYAVSNPVELAKRYNLVASNIRGKNYGHDVLASERIIKGIVDELLSKGIAVIITSHMKDKWLVPGQKEIKARKWVYEAASLVAILIRTDSAPDAIIFKNAFSYHETVDSDDLTDEQLEKYQRGEIQSTNIISRLPRRIPGLTTQKIARYLARTSEEIQANPYSEEETLQESDIAPYSEMLSKWQLANLEKILAAEEMERERFHQDHKNILLSQRASLDQEILDYDPEVPIKQMIKALIIKYEMLASEITPIYILKIRQGG